MTNYIGRVFNPLQIMRVIALGAGISIATLSTPSNALVLAEWAFENATAGDPTAAASFTALGIGNCRATPFR